jgi:hypothetical protein
MSRTACRTLGRTLGHAVRHVQPRGLPKPLGLSDGHIFSIRVSVCPTEPEAVTKGLTGDVRTVTVAKLTLGGEVVRVRRP